MFIVFEGVDGSGTSTQAALLHSALVKKQLKAVLTSEPTAGPIGHLIREILTKRVHIAESAEIVDRELAYLFAADRFDHLYNTIDGIESRLQQGFTIISTRYFLSSFAYNAHTEQDFELVRTLNQNFRRPDLTFYFICPLEESMRRIQADGRGPDRNENLENLRRVKENYERAFKVYDRPFITIDATEPVQQMHGHILDVVMQHKQREAK